MSYDYKTEKKELFTDHGQKLLFAVYNAASALDRQAGAFDVEHIGSAVIKSLGAYTNFTLFAALDRLVEMNLILDITPDAWAANKVYQLVSSR